MGKGISAKRITAYTVGMLVLAIGLTLTAQAGLGTSPLTSIAFVLGKWIQIPFSDATPFMFFVFVLVQIILEKEKMIRNIGRLLLQIPLSILFTRIIGLIQKLVDLTDAGLVLRITVLLLGIVLTGVGATMTLCTNLIQNPGDEIVKAIAAAAGKPVGTTKNIFDICNVAAAVAISSLALGRLEGVGIGSVIAMLGVGRVIASFNKLVKTGQ